MAVIITTNRSRIIMIILLTFGYLADEGLVSGASAKNP